MTATRAHALITAGYVTLTFPYSAKLIRQLKESIPAASRTYSPERKSWTVFSPHIEMAVSLAYEVFPDLAIDDRTSSRYSSSWKKRAPQADPEYAALHLLPSAPAPLVDAAYKCLARIHHPDMGGDTATMQRLNEAHESIRARHAS